MYTYKVVHVMCACADVLILVYKHWNGAYYISLIYMYMYVCLSACVRYCIVTLYMCTCTLSVGGCTCIHVHCIPFPPSLLPPGRLPPRLS